MAAVCKRWFGVFYSANCDLWRNCGWYLPPRMLRDKRQMAACLRVFLRTAALTEWAEFGAEAEAEPRWQQAAAQHLPIRLAGLDPAVLKGLSIEAMPLLPAALQALPLFRELRILNVCSGLPGSSPAAELPAAVAQLGALEEFHVLDSSVETALLAALCRLPKLAFLDLHSTESPLPPLDALASLASQLTRLSLVERHSSDSGLRLPRTAAFPNLERLFVAAPVLQASAGLACMHERAGIWNSQHMHQVEWHGTDPPVSNAGSRQRPPDCLGFCRQLAAAALRGGSIRAV